MEQIRQGSGLQKRFRALGPTERSDGVALPVSEISHYIRTLSYNGGPPEEMHVALVEDASTPEYDGEFDEVVDVDAIGAGTYVYSYRTVDTDGRESVESVSVGLEILLPLVAPNPPTDITVI